MLYNKILKFQTKIKKINKSFSIVIFTVIENIFKNGEWLITYRILVIIPTKKTSVDFLIY